MIQNRTNKGVSELRLRCLQPADAEATDFK